MDVKGKGLSDIIEEEKKKTTISGRVKQGFDRLKNLTARRSKVVEAKRDFVIKKTGKAFGKGADFVKDSYERQIKGELGKKYTGFKKNPFAYKKGSNPGYDVSDLHFSPGSFLGGNKFYPINGSNGKGSKRLVIKL